MTIPASEGTAVGLAVLVSVAVDRANELLSADADPPVAAAGGFALSFAGAAGVTVAGALLALLAVRRGRSRQSTTGAERREVASPADH